MPNEIKLYDVSYQAKPIGVGSRLETYWKKYYSVLMNGLKIRRCNSKDILDNILMPVEDTPYFVMMYYKLKGSQFGNWVKQIDWVNHFGGCVLALADLCALMYSKNLGFDHNILLRRRYGISVVSTQASLFATTLNFCIFETCMPKRIPIDREVRCGFVQGYMQIAEK